MSKSLIPAKQAASRYKALQARVDESRTERVMEQLATAVEIGIERGVVHVQIHKDDLDVARRLLKAEGYVWSEPDRDPCNALRDGGATHTLKLDLTQHQEPSDE